MTQATYEIAVDWHNAGCFNTFPYTFPLVWEAANHEDDITNDVKSLSFSRGKDTQLGKAAVGSLEMRVNNNDKKYSPEYSSSPLYGNLLPKRPLRVRANYGGTWYNLFYGFIEEIIPHPHPQEKDCYISALDGLDFLSRAELDTVLWKNQLTGTLVGNILDAVGWNDTKRSIDAGQDTVPYAFWHDVSSRYALEEIEDSELGFICVDGRGYLCYEDRHHRYKPPHYTSQATFSDTMVDLTYNYNAANIFNLIRATITPWELKAEAELWRLEDTPQLAAGENQDFWGNSEYFVDAWVTPVATTDYSANTEADGSGEDKTADIAITTSKFAQAILLKVKNNASVTVYLTLLKARGTYYDDKTTLSRKAEDTTSQTTYQKRTFTLDGKFLTDADKAQAFCDYALSKYKDPRPLVTLTLVNKDTTNLTQILERKVSDRITVACTEMGMDRDFFIDQVQHDVTEGGKLHRATWILADASGEAFWSLDYSKLNTETKVGY